ncbi:protein NO VEIN domain-containing protein [Streptomyces sp. bgisy100]|uniref:protein NO VEIN domain-containing protein n=1 Tax=Streptomyces sp. bgisy100 TaxID=3413783 RepID=UPI003D71173A
MRWLTHLRTEDVSRARALFTHQRRYADLAPVQYADALAWLRRSGLLGPDGRPVLEECLRTLEPLILGWQKAAAAGGVDADALCDEAWTAARGLGLEWHPLAGLHLAGHGEADPEKRRRTGLAGELAILALLRAAGCQVRHVAAVSDRFGYDIEVSVPGGLSVHLEVKATVGADRLVVHLTRHEYETMRADPEWSMVAVLVDAGGEAAAVATVRRAWLASAVPEDQNERGRWESVRLAVPPVALLEGIRAGADERPLLDRSGCQRATLRYRHPLDCGLTGMGTSVAVWDTAAEQWGGLPSERAGARAKLWA